MNAVQRKGVVALNCAEERARRKKTWHGMLIKLWTSAIFLLLRFALLMEDR